MRGRVRMARVRCERERVRMLRRKPTRIQLKESDEAELDAIERKSKNESNNKKVEDDTKTKDRVAQRIGFTKKK